VSQGHKQGELAVKLALGDGEGGIADGAAPMTLDGLGGTPSTGEQEDEGMAEGVELVEVDGVVVGVQLVAYGRWWRRRSQVCRGEQ